MTACAHYACVRRTYEHRVCMDHLIAALQAGKRAATHAGTRRLDHVVRARYDPAEQWPAPENDPRQMSIYDALEEATHAVP